MDGLSYVLQPMAYLHTCLALSISKNLASDHPNISQGKPRDGLRGSLGTKLLDDLALTELGHRGQTIASSGGC